MTAGPEMLPVRQEAIDDAAEKIAASEAAVAEATKQAEAIEVATPEQAQAATQILTDLAGRLKLLEGERKELVKPLKDYTKGLDEKYKLAKAPVEAAAKTLKGKLVQFNAAEERRRQEQQARLDAERREAERIIEERRAKEAADLEAEAKAKRAEAAEAVELAEEDSELEELADEARADARAAEARAATLASLPAPNLPAKQVAPAPKLNGATATKRWDFEVIDLASVPDFLPDGTPLKTVDTAALRRYMHEVVRETKAPPEMGGVEFKQVDGLAVRG